jgi:hypothetical protein
MVIVLIVMLFGISRIAKLWREVKKGEEALEATKFHCDMGELAVSMAKDPSTTRHDWEQILSNCEEADDRFAETHPYLKQSYRLSDGVRYRINITGP